MSGSGGTSHHAGPGVELLREIPDDAALGTQWNALVLQTHNPQVFYTYEWARSVQLAYGDSLCPLLLLGYDENRRLMGVAALAAPKAGPVSFLCATTGDYCDFVVSPHDAVVFTIRVLETLRQEGYRDVVLANFPEDSPSYAALRAAASPRGFHMYARTAYKCAQVRLPTMLGATSKLALPRQKMVRRSIRLMGEGAPLTTIHESAWENVNSKLSEFFRAHIARFLFTDRLSNMLRPERRRFLSELAQLLSPTGWLCLTRLNVGPRTVAWNYGFAFCGTWFLYQPTFVNHLEKHSPGFVLLYKMVEEAAENPALETVDLGLGAETYKESFANGSRRTMYVTLHRSLLEHWKEIARYRAAQAIRAWPRAEQAARNLLAKAHELQTRLQQKGVWSTLAGVVSRMRGWVFSRRQFVFYEGAAVASVPSQGFRQNEHPQPGVPQEEFSLQPVSYELLAEAAMQCYDDDHALQYLLRSARRMRQGEAEGFVLIDAQRRPVHFAWASACDVFFRDQWKAAVPAPSTNAVLLFDGWSPESASGCGYHGRAARLIADRLRRTGKQPWILVPAIDTAAILEIEQAGFRRRYSVVRRKMFGLKTVKGQPPLSPEAPPAEVSAPF